jgi:hypothetical protein
MVHQPNQSALVWQVISNFGMKGRSRKRASGRSIWKLAVSRLIAALPRFLRPASAAFAPIKASLGITATGITVLLGTRAQ